MVLLSFYYLPVGSVFGQKHFMHETVFIPGDIYGFIETILFYSIIVLLLALVVERTDWLIKILWKSMRHTKGK